MEGEAPAESRKIWGFLTAKHANDRENTEIWQIFFGKMILNYNFFVLNFRKTPLFCLSRPNTILTPPLKMILNGHPPTPYKQNPVHDGSTTPPISPQFPLQAKHLHTDTKTLAPFALFSFS